MGFAVGFKTYDEPAVVYGVERVRRGCETNEEYPWHHWWNY
jgi:hypothetical protein